MKAHLFYALAATTLLIGCSTTPNLTKAECDALNWQQLGAQDGAKGDTKEQLNRHQEACATHSVQPNTAAYQAGVAQGIEQYCVYKNGLATGQNGEEFNSACAEDRYILFGSGWLLGNSLFKLESTLETASRELEKTQQKIDVTESQIDKLGNEIDNATTDESRLRAVDRQESLKSVLAELENKIIVVQNNYSITLEQYEATKKKIDATIKKLTTLHLN